MIEWNLTAANPAEELIKNYLQENADEALAAKINNGTPYEKDGKQLINKKTLPGFVRYATDEARKAAEKGARAACITDDVVYGWATHYFEEDSIVGTLYTEDGQEYKPAPKVTKNAPKVYVSPKPEVPKEAQCSIFDMLDDSLPEEPKKEEPPTKTQGETLYQRYTEIQSRYPDHVVAYRIGDFYEVFGENAAPLAKDLELTLTSRDCGQDTRVPMIGFPYHTADRYIDQMTEKGYTVAVVESADDVRTVEPELIVDRETGEVLTPDENQSSTAFDHDALQILLRLLGKTFTVR